LPFERGRRRHVSGFSKELNLESFEGLKLAPGFISIVQNFQIEGEFCEAVPYGDGHINDTYMTFFRGADGRVSRYILQRINHAVFKKPEWVMHNMERVTAHIRQVVSATGGDPSRKTVTLIPTRSGKFYYKSPAGDYWRASHFIAGARSYPRARNPQHSYHAAATFGEFLKLLSDFPPSELYEPIPDFHHTPKRYLDFINAVEHDPLNRAHNVSNEIKFITQREPDASVLLDLLDIGGFPIRVTHNDTKIDNVMIDDCTGEGVCVVDLDTVMPGLTVFDFGDLVRSGANMAVEDEPDSSKAGLNLVIFEWLAHGFLDATRDFLTTVEAAHLSFGAKVITFEQAIRFLTDYLNGDVYYKTQRLDQNIDRTRTQLGLIADMENKFNAMEVIINKFR
jgi:hypothetical protein